MHAVGFKLRNHSLLRSSSFAKSMNNILFMRLMVISAWYMLKAKTAVAFKPLSRHFNFSSLHSSILATVLAKIKD